MADVCIIYTRDDAGHLPGALETLLSPDVSVWWDKKILSGDYRSAILHQLRIAGCVIPIWSPRSTGSMVIDEAEQAREFGTPLLPLSIHGGLPPLGFARIQTTTAIGWSGELDRREVLGHIQKVKSEIANRRGPKARPKNLLLTTQSALPVYFFSLSSYETKISPQRGIEALHVLGAKSVLVSAQDTEAAPLGGKLMGNLKRISRAGGIVLLDSGNYEAGRITKLGAFFDKGVASSLPAWSLKRYYDALKRTPHDMAFAFDKVKPPANDLGKIVASAVSAVRRDQAHSAQPVLPILHLPYGRDGRVRTKNAPEAIRRVAETLEPPLIGVPERELGEGIIERVTTMKQIRNALNELLYYQPVHVLGTGDPISVALLSAAGADSFDGLEWCRFVLDADRARLYPMQDYDFFRWQDEVSPFKPSAGEQEDSQTLTWLGRVAVHNIEFYLGWMKDLRRALSDETRLVEFLTKLVPGNELDDVRSVLWNAQ